MKVECPRCGGTMKVVSIINPWHRDVIDGILTHCGLSQEPPRAPPQPSAPATHELRYVSDLECIDAPAPPEPVWSHP